MASWTEVVIAFAVFIIFWGVVAWQSKGEQGFFATFLDKIGLGFYYKRTWPAIFVGAIFSAVMLFLLSTALAYAEENVWLVWLAIAYFVTPFVLLVLYPFSKKSETMKRVVAAMSAVWFTLFLLAIIAFAVTLWLMN